MKKKKVRLRNEPREEKNKIRMTAAQKMREKIKEKSSKNKGKKVILKMDQKEGEWDFPEKDLSIPGEEKVEIRRDKKPSKYQEEVYLNTITTNKNVAVKSTAGSGKTYTLIEVSKLIPYGKRIVFLAFAKANVNDLRNKLESHVECSTLHSLGMKSIRNHYPGESSVYEKKAIKYIEPLCDNKIVNGKEERRTNREKWSLIYQIDQIMRMVRATMTPLELDKIEELCDEYTLDYTEEVGKLTIRALRSFYNSNDDPEKFGMVCDFQDMIEHCVRHREIRLPQYDYLLIDECQDLSQLDQMFIQRLVRPVVGRIFSFGDPKQAIYSFRGAKIDSFETFERRENTITLPLSICYRCTKQIVRNAKKIYNDIEENPEGEDGPEPRKGKIEEIREGDFVLCRNTRPLIDVFFRLIERGIKAYVCGKDSEQGLLSLLSRFDGSEKTNDSYDGLKTTLEKVEDNLKSKGYLNVKNHKRYILMEEKVSILKILFAKFSFIYEVEEFIKRVFDDQDRDGVALMTIHRSKGLENDRVFVIEEYDNKKLIPSSYATTKNQLIQEKNLSFVASTRAKKELIYLHIK